MGQACSVCTRPDSLDVNEALVIEGRSNRAVARQFGLHHDAVRRHRKHIPELLVRAAEDFQSYEAASILAVTRFSGKRAPKREGADPVTREAYSHEVISCGFWAGDQNVREPAFYSYTAPEPMGLTDQPLRPEAALWLPEGGMALLTYEEVRNSASPKGTLLEFLQSAYEAGAKSANWDIEHFRARPVR